MLRNCEILRNRPYFGGIKSNQVRYIFELNHCNWGENVLSFNIHSGVDGFYRIVSCPFKENDSWHIFLEEIGSYHRTNGDIKIRLDRYSVVCYQNSEWEKEWCLIKVDVTSPEQLKNKKLKPLSYFPRYY